MMFDGMAVHYVAVKTACHKVSPPILLKQPAFVHDDPCPSGHQKICVLDPAVISSRPQLEIFADTIEFQKPMLKAFCRIELPAMDNVRFRVPGNDRLRARASSRSTYVNDIGKGCLGMCIVREISLDQLACFLHEGFHFKRCSAFSMRTSLGLELQGTHSSLAHVGQAVERCHSTLFHTVLGHPRINESIAECVGQCVSQHSRQAMKCWNRKVGKNKRGGSVVNGQSEGR